MGKGLFPPICRIWHTKRVAGKNEFQKLPENAVIPFEEK